MGKLSYKVADIKGIGAERGAKLAELGVGTLGKLYERGRTSAGRKELVAKMGDLASPHLMLEWVNRADLFRISGISSQYSDLLEKAGVDSVKELAQRNASNLHKKLGEVNRTKGLVKRLPPLNDIQRWIEQAQELPRGVEH